VFGGQDPYLPQGKWQFVAAYRGFLSDKHYQGTEPFPQLDANGPRNRQNQFNFDFTYAVTPRLNLSLNIPVHFNSFAVRRSPGPAQEPVWVTTRSDGLGDVGVRARYWLLPAGRRTANLGLIVGLKTPTGKAGRADDFLGRTVAVDTSVQTGDKSWGVNLGLQAFKNFETISFYGAGMYLFNPRGSTRVPTFFGSLNNPRNSTYNSASDQFLFQFGSALKSPVRPWLPVPTMGYRIEGVPITDVFGSSSGFRRPGTFGFLEPGVTFALGKHMFAVTLPISSYRNVKDSPFSGRIEDATIPKFMVTVAYSIRP
jgi:hypothetical protein